VIYVDTGGFALISIPELRGAQIMFLEICFSAHFRSNPDQTYVNHLNKFLGRNLIITDRFV